MRYFSFLRLIGIFFLAFTFTHCDDGPSSVSSCGDDFLDPGEQCDGAAFAVADCQALGFYEQAGALSCKSDCTVDTSACSLRCGDGVVSAAHGEQCDGVNLEGQTCLGLGFVGGVIACGPDCLYDTSQCLSICGNGVPEPGEGCDDDGNDPGDGCSPLCQPEEGWTCAGTPSYCEPVCGDDLLLGDEVCDTSQLDGATCESLGYHGGALACTEACTHDVTDCEAAGRCGDGIIQGDFGEECEGTDLGGQGCHELDFWTGQLACSAGCAFDTAGCLGVTSVVQGGRFTCAVLTDRTVRCWGRNQRGQLGDGTTVDRLAAAPVTDLTGVTALGLGGSHACAVLTDGSVKCWGWNAYGQLGLGSIVDQATPTTVPGLANVNRVTAGERHTCAVLADGSMRCWGFNGNGRLGDNTATDRMSPVAVSGLGSVRDASCGGDHTCAVTAQGHAFCWGKNLHGQLGIGTTTESRVPVRVSDFLSADRIVAGYRHTCVHFYSSSNPAGGTALCWGSNSHGQLGDRMSSHGSTCGEAGDIADCSRSPVTVTGFSGAIAELALTPYSTCLRTDLGALWCWGRNDYGQVGDGTFSNRAVPVQVTFPVIARLWPGLGSHLCATRPDTPDVFCWGWNDVGQVGDGTLENRNAPTTVVRP